MTDEPRFAAFDHDDAWHLGRTLADQCRSENLPVTITIHLGEQRVFHAALRGTSADNDDWAMRKTRVVRRFDQSSHQVGLTYASIDPVVFHTLFALPPADYAATGGAVPIRVGNAQVGVLAVSGLDSAEDHARALAALREASQNAVVER